MSPEEQERLDLLKAGPCAPVEYVRDYYGLPWPLPDDLRPTFEAWQNKLPRRASCPENTISRYEIEAFMQKNGVIPKKWMGARLGMTVQSLDELLSRLNDLGMRLPRYLVYQDLVAESLKTDLVPNLPGLRFRVFSDHTSFCERLHADLKDVLGIEVQPLFCATSKRLGEYPLNFAIDFDCITLAPLSGKHQLWLDFRKPNNLPPDRCSKLFYAENREILQPFYLGSREPDDLGDYLHFLGAVHGG